MARKTPRKAGEPPALPPPERRVVLCVIGAPHGVRGECRVKSFCEEPAAIGDYGPLFAGDGQVFEVEALRPLKDDMLVVRFAGIDDRDVIARLTGRELFVDRNTLPEAEEETFYHADLLGLAIVDLDGAPVGTLMAIHNFGAGDMLELRPASGGQTWLQPFSKRAVPGIDLAARRITIDPAFLSKPDPRQADPDLAANEPGDG